MTRDAERTPPSTPTQDEWRAIFNTPCVERGWHTDEEAAAAAFVTPRTLRTLQASKLIRSESAPTGQPGGVRRMWASQDVYIASVASELMRQLDWSVPKAAAVLRLAFGVNREFAAPLISDALSGTREEYQAEPTAKIVRRHPDDWFLSIYSSRFLFLRVPESARAVFAADGCEFPIGLILGDRVHQVFYRLENEKFFEESSADMERELVEEMRKEVQLCRDVCRHSNLGIWVDLSMPIRAARRRLAGLEAEYVDDVVIGMLAQPK